MKPNAYETLSTVWHAPFYAAGKGDDRYVSDADLDPTTGILYFSLQDYNRRDRTTVQSFDMRQFNLTSTISSIGANNLSCSLLTFSDTKGESHVILLYANVTNVNSLFVLASGASKLFRFNLSQVILLWF